MLKPNFNFIKNYFILLNAEVWFNETLALELDVKWQWLRAARKHPMHSGPAPKPQVTLFMKKIGLFLCYSWKSGMRMWEQVGFVKFCNWVKQSLSWLTSELLGCCGSWWRSVLDNMCGAVMLLRWEQDLQIETVLGEEGGEALGSIGPKEVSTGPTVASGTSTLNAHTWFGPGT